MAIWSADGYPGWSADGWPGWSADGFITVTVPPLNGGGPSGTLEVTDNLNGSVNLAWPTLTATSADSFNIYVNGVLKQNTPTRLATISGLTVESYNPGTGVITPSGTYDFNVVAVKAGVEVVSSQHVRMTISPTSIALRTPMKRLWPFPNSGLD